MLAVLRPIFIYLISVETVFGLSRLGLTLWLADRVAAVGTHQAAVNLLFNGLRFDAMLLALLLLAAVPLTIVLAVDRRTWTYWRPVSLGYLALVAGAAVFMEAATPSFIDQYDARPNALFFEYLKYPREVFSTLLAAYKLPLALGVTLTYLAVKFSWRYLDNAWPKEAQVKWWQALVAAPVLLLLFAGVARGSLDHRPANPSSAAFSADPLVNDLALNSLYSVAYAAYALRHEEQGGIRYSNMQDEKMLRIVRDALLIPASDFVDPAIPMLHRNHPQHPGGPPRNVVIVMEESLGAEFVGSMGGKDLTPRLDALSKQGMWFSNLYATGTRSVRGIEAVVTGFPPTPARSVVKLNGAQRDFFTMAQLLKRYGYHTSFIYGGESHFDNMARFFLGNGFERVIDKKDYAQPVFSGSWGVSDEDLFQRAHQEFLTYGDRPFFSLVFTTSNHSPYEYPEGRIAPVGDANTVDNAVRYADYALGEFIESARQSPYWNNTVFLVVADHNSRVYGATLVPVERFHVPALILGGGIAPDVVQTVASQIDLLPTLLSLAGVEAAFPAVGRDLTDPVQRARPGHAFMQYYSAQAYMEGDALILLQADRPAESYRYRDGRLEQSESTDSDLVERALAHSRWPQWAYSTQNYRLPADKEASAVSQLSFRAARP